MQGMISTLSYPFPAAPLDEASVRFVVDELAAFEAAHGLLVRRPALLAVEAAFLTHCSPPAPSRDALAVMSRILYLVLYFNDHVHREHLGAEASLVWAAVCGRPESQDRERTTCPSLVAASREAGAALRQALAQRGAELTSFSHLFRVNLAAFVWVAERHTTPVTVTEHLEVRQETISAIAYLRLWGLLIGLKPDDELRYGLHLQRCERLSALVQALANDLRSVERDRQEGQPNAVLLEQSAQADPASQAALRIAARHAQALAELIDALAVARRAATASSPAFFAYLTFIEICTRGNNTAMTALVNRYR